MKKISLYFLILLVTSIITLFIFKDQLIENFILNNIKKQTGLQIKLQENASWDLFPILNYYNSNVTISHESNSFKIDNAKINLNKNYWPLSPIFINLTSPAINYNGIEIRNSNIEVKYMNKTIYIKNFFGNIIEGNLFLTGVLDIDEKKPFNIKGKFENIPLNTLLKQSKIASWDRVKINLSSHNFNISGKINENKDWSKSITGTFPIKGSLYFTSSEEERFGAALLSILVEKIPSLISISKSVDFLLSTYANKPSNISGVLTLENGLIKSEEIFIKNEEGKSILKGSYNLLKNNIDGTIYFYKQKEIFLEASLKGNIANPQILIGGKVFSENEIKPMQNIKELLEKGINSFVEKMLMLNE